MLSTVMVRVRTDLALAVSSSDVTEGLIIAQNGLRTYLASATERPADGDSIRINVQGGYAMVVARLVQRPTDTLDNWRFVIRSTGYVIKPADGSDPRAIRTVGQFADWQHGAIYTSAALTAINGVDVKSVENLKRIVSKSARTWKVTIGRGQQVFTVTFRA